MSRLFDEASLLKLCAQLRNQPVQPQRAEPVYTNLSDADAVKELLSRASALVAFRLRDEEAGLAQR